MAAEQDDANFKSQLNDESKEKAKVELGEKSDKDRELAVQALRGWVIQQKWLKTPTDFEFLLRFLRVRKYSQLAARQSIEKYWTTKTKYPDWFHNLDPADNKLQEILRSGMFFITMRPDKKGRRVFIGREYMIPVETIKKQFGIENIMRAIALMSEYMVLDENVQVNGYAGLEDMTNMSMSHIYNLYTKEVNDVWMKFYEKSLPARFKGFHIYKEPVFMDTVMAIFKPLMPKKWLERMTLHGNSLAKVYDDIDMACLPDEYLPDEYEGPRLGTVADCAEAMIKDMNRPEIRKYLLEISSPKYGVDLALKEKDDVPAASFRKLDVN